MDIQMQGGQFSGQGFSRAVQRGPDRMIPQTPPFSRFAGRSKGTSTEDGGSTGDSGGTLGDIGRLFDGKD